MHTSSQPHYGWAAIGALAVVIVPWALLGWFIWTMTQ
jgi:hypothetical protein